MQRHWIGKSEGVEVDFKIVGGGEFSIYTTCIETIYGITFMVLAPDGRLVKELMPRIENKEEVEAYAKLPSKETLLSQLVFMLQSPIQRVAIALNEIAKKNEEQSA